MNWFPCLTVYNYKISFARAHNYGRDPSLEQLFNDSHTALHVPKTFNFRKIWRCYKLARKRTCASTIWLSRRSAAFGLRKLPCRMSSKARRALGPLVLVVWAALLVDGHAAAPAVDAGEGLRRPPGRRLREETPSVGVLALDQVRGHPASLPCCWGGQGSQSTCTNYRCPTRCRLLPTGSWRLSSRRRPRLLTQLDPAGTPPRARLCTAGCARRLRWTRASLPSRSTRTA